MKKLRCPLAIKTKINKQTMAKEIKVVIKETTVANSNSSMGIKEPEVLKTHINQELFSHLKLKTGTNKQQCLQ